MRRGRKPISNEPSTLVGVYLPLTSRSILVKLANSRGVSLSAAVRVAVDRGIKALIEDADKAALTDLLRNREVPRAVEGPEAPLA
jgi:hypothetical protein